MGGERSRGAFPPFSEGPLSSKVGLKFCNKGLATISNWKAVQRTKSLQCTKVAFLPKKVVRVGTKGFSSNAKERKDAVLLVVVCVC